jgi:hypothetical protein
LQFAKITSPPNGMAILFPPFTQLLLKVLIFKPIKLFMSQSINCLLVKFHQKVESKN